MADITVESALAATGTSEHWVHSRVFLTKDVGYDFFLDNVNNKQLCYKKTTDGGATWGTKVVFYDRGGEGGVACFSVWFDEWTEGITGDLIHVVWLDEGDEARWSALDTSDDSVATPVNIVSLAVFGSDGGFNDTSIEIAKMKGGNLVVWLRSVSSSNVVYRSTDGGASWAARNDALETTDDQFIVLPADGTGDDNDGAIIYHDASADALSVKMYDDSANTHTETAIATMVEDSGGNYFNYDAMLSHSQGKIFVAFCNNHNNAANDLKFYSVTPNSIASPTVSELTNVLTDTIAISPRVIIDEVNGRVIVFYARGTVSATTVICYKISTDWGSTWGSEQTFSDDTSDDFRNIATSRIVRNGDTGRLQASWTNDDLADLMTNVANSVAIEAAAGASGDIAATLKPAEAAFNGEHSQTGAIESDLRAATASLSGEQLIEGAIAAELQPATAAFTGEQTQSGSIIAALQPALAAFLGEHAQAGSIVATLQAAQAALTGYMQPTGEIAATLLAATASFTGESGNPGDIAGTLQFATASFTGAHSQSGTIAASLPTATASVTGFLHIEGEMAATMQPATAAFEGAHGNDGVLSASLRPATASISATMQPEGEIAANLRPPTAMFTGEQSVEGAMAGTLPAATSEMSAEQIVAGILAATLRSAQAALSGEHGQAGNLVATLQFLTAALFGQQAITGSLAATLRAPTAAFVEVLTVIYGIPITAIVPYPTGITARHVQPVGIEARTAQPIEVTP